MSQRAPTSATQDGWLTVDEEYEVFGIGTWESELNFLVRSDATKPMWMPAVLFEVIDNHVPDGWKFALRDGVTESVSARSNKWVFMCGYAELIDDVHHSDHLMERDEDALRIFAARYVQTLDEIAE